MRWIVAAGLAFGAALAGNAQNGGAEPLEEALLQLGSYKWEIIVTSRGAFMSTDPCDRGAYRYGRMQRDKRMHQAMTRLADLPKAEQTELVRGALQHHLAVYNAHLPEYLESWNARLADVDANERIMFYIMRERTTGKGDSDDLFHWSREAILRLVVIAAAFELTGLADEVDAIVRSAVETRDRVLFDTTSEQISRYAWDGLCSSTLYEPSVLAIGLSLAHEAARNPENLRSPLHDHFIVFVGRWHADEVGRTVWRRPVAADGTVVRRGNLPSDDTAIASFLFAECLDEDQFAALLRACGFETEAAQ